MLRILFGMSSENDPDLPEADRLVSFMQWIFISPYDVTPPLSLRDLVHHHHLSLREDMVKGVSVGSGPSHITSRGADWPHHQISLGEVDFEELVQSLTGFSRLVRCLVKAEEQLQRLIWQDRSKKKNWRGKVTTCVLPLVIGTKYFVSNDINCALHPVTTRVWWRWIFWWLWLHMFMMKKKRHSINSDWYTELMVAPCKFRFFWGGGLVHFLAEISVYLVSQTITFSSLYHSLFNTSEHHSYRYMQLRTTRAP